VLSLLLILSLAFAGDIYEGVVDLGPCPHTYLDIDGSLRYRRPNTMSYVVERCPIDRVN